MSDGFRLSTAEDATGAGRIQIRTVIHLASHPAPPVHPHKIHVFVLDLNCGCLWSRTVRVGIAVPLIEGVCELIRVVDWAAVTKGERCGARREVPKDTLRSPLFEVAVLAVVVATEYNESRREESERKR